MKTVKELINRKGPIAAIDPSLDKFHWKITFPDKLAKANKMLKTAKLPLNQHCSLQSPD